MNIRKKSTTVLLADGKRVSWFNVNYLEVVQILDENGIKSGFEFIVKWKYKASIKSETFFSPMVQNELNKYFARFGIVPLTETVYVNLAKISIVTEEQIYGPIEKTRVKMIFVDGYQFQEKIDSAKWSWWKQTYL